MFTNNIKSKLDARLFAIEQANLLLKHSNSDVEQLISSAKQIERYVVADIKLPEVYDDTDNTKMLVEALSKSYTPINNEQLINKD